MNPFGKSREKLVCAQCRYETDYQGTYRKPPACPHCKNLLSFKDSLESVYEEEIPFLNKLFWLIAAGGLFAGIWLVGQHFKTWEDLSVVSETVRVNEVFYGGKSRSRIPVTIESAPYSYQAYWTAQPDQKPVSTRTAGRAAGRYSNIMAGEKHEYLYQGLKSGQVYVQYVYTGRKGRTGTKLFMLPFKQNAAILQIPANPHVKKSKPASIRIEPLPDGTARVREIPA